MLRIRSIAALGVALWLSPWPSVPQKTDERPLARNDAAPTRELVDINHATVEQLLTVPGLTRSWAQRILRFRPYHSKLELFQEGVLPGPLYYRIRDYIIAHHDHDQE